jgi:hypothetical protein
VRRSKSTTVGTAADQLVARFTSPEWSSAHYQTAPAQTLASAISSEKVKASTEARSHLTPAYSFSRSGLTYPNPKTHIVVTSFGYHPGYTAYSVEGWKTLAAYCEANEASALSMSVVEDKTAIPSAQFKCLRMLNMFEMFTSRAMR